MRTFDYRERMSEALGRVITSVDMTDSLPLDFSLAEFARRPYSHRRLFPIDMSAPATQTAHAIVSRGAWVMPCPFCQGQEYADPVQPLFLCCSCWNQEVGGRPLIVAFPEPAEKVVIEGMLLARPVAKHRRWQQGMGPKEMAEDYEWVQAEGTPTDRSTADLITAAIWNGAVGSSGDMQYLWATHNHDGGAGDGGTIPIVPNHDHTGDAGDGATLANKAILGAGIYALGQKQGAGANLLRIEYKSAGGQLHDQDEAKNYSVTWDNTFAAILACVATLQDSSIGGTNWIWLLVSKSVTGATLWAKPTNAGGTSDGVEFIAIGY